MQLQPGVPKLDKKEAEVRKMQTKRNMLPGEKKML